MKKGISFARSLMQLLVACALLCLAHHVRMFASVGSVRFIFSGINGLAPLLYGLVGSVGSVVLLSLGRVLRLLGYTGLPCGTVTMGLATQASILVWQARQSLWGQRFMNLLLPFVAIAFFVLHPATGIGAWYAVFWVIPMVMHFVSDSLFKTAVQSTFVAHAVGSCLWLVTVPMAPMDWLALMPYVCVERFVYVGFQMVLVFLVMAEHKKECFLDMNGLFKRAS